MSVKKTKANELLAEWVLMVRSEVEKKGEFHAEGLGLFVLDEGKLVFMPDEKLTIEVNYKYAGMKSIEVLPGYTHAAKKGFTPDDINIDSEEDTLMGDKETADAHEEVEVSEDSERPSLLPENKELGGSADFDDENESDHFAVDVDSEQDNAKKSEKSVKSEKDNDAGAVTKHEEAAEENIDDDDPFALGDEITDEILFGDEKEYFAEDKSDSENQDDSFEVLENEESEPIETGYESKSPVDRDDAFDVFEDEESEPVKPGDESKSPIYQDDAFDVFEDKESEPVEPGDESKSPVEQDDAFDVFEDEESEPVEPGDESKSPIYQDDAFDVFEDKKSDPVEPGDESKSPVDLEDDVFITEEELFGSSTVNEKAEDDSGQGKNQKEDVKSSLIADDDSNVTDQDKSESKEEEPLRESPVGKTTGIGIRPGSKTKQKSGIESMSVAKSIKTEATPESLDHEKVKPSGISGTDSKAGKKKSVTSTRDSGSQIWLVPIAAAAILLVLFYFHFEDQIMGRFQSTPNVDAIIVPPANEDEPITGNGEMTANDDGVVVEDEGAAALDDEEIQSRTESVQDENNINQSLGETTEEDETSIGLRGPEVEVNRGAYTIVVHSIVDENRANIEKTTLLEEGFRALMWHASLPDGRTTWRVGIGQFESVSDAEQALTELPEPYRSNNFIVRIR